VQQVARPTRSPHVGVYGNEHGRQALADEPPVAPEELQGLPIEHDVRGREVRGADVVEHHGGVGGLDGGRCFEGEPLLHVGDCLAVGAFDFDEAT